VDGVDESGRISCPFRVFARTLSQSRNLFGTPLQRCCRLQWLIPVFDSTSGQGVLCGSEGDAASRVKLFPASVGT
jgi:hypothetical protein